MKYTVWAKDQYLRNEILTVLSTKGIPENDWVTPEEALAAAKRYAHDKNRNNPLTFEEQFRNVTHVVFEIPVGIYAGNLIHAKHKVIKTAEATVPPSDILTTETMLENDIEGKFYLGQTPMGEPWYLTDARKRPATKLDDYNVTDKTILFVHSQAE